VSWFSAGTGGKRQRGLRQDRSRAASRTQMGCRFGLAKGNEFGLAESGPRGGPARKVNRCTDGLDPLLHCLVNAEKDCGLRQRSGMSPDEDPLSGWPRGAPVPLPHSINPLAVPTWRAADTISLGREASPFSVRADA
jgi:hypothetical protein